MRIILEMQGFESRPYPLDHKRRHRVMVELVKRDMNISDLARELDFSRVLISNVISGRRLSPKTEKLIANFLKKPVNYLFPSRSGEELKKMRQAEAAAKGKTA